MLVDRRRVSTGRCVGKFAEIENACNQDECVCFAYGEAECNAASGVVAAAVIDINGTLDPAYVNQYRLNLAKSGKMLTKDD